MTYLIIAGNACLTGFSSTLRIITFADLALMLFTCAQEKKSFFPASQSQGSLYLGVE
jgi:hypothetical protein